MIDVQAPEGYKVKVQKRIAKMIELGGTPIDILPILETAYELHGGETSYFKGMKVCVFPSNELVDVYKVMELSNKRKIWPNADVGRYMTAVMNSQCVSMYDVTNEKEPKLLAFCRMSSDNASFVILSDFMVNEESRYQQLVAYGFLSIILLFDFITTLRDVIVTVPTLFIENPATPGFYMSQDLEFAFAQFGFKVVNVTGDRDHGETTMFMKTNLTAYDNDEQMAAQAKKTDGGKS